MQKSITSKLVSAVSLAAAIAILVPGAAMAREGGARSVGKGIKCYTAAVPKPDGTIKYTQVCYKSI